MDSRLQGMGKIESVVMVTVGGNAWDGLTDVGALGIEVNFDETLANRILDPELLYALNSLISAERSVVGPVTRCGQQLKNLAQRYLNQLGQDAQLFTPDRIGRDHDLLRLDAQDPQPESEDTLVEMARTVLEELALTRLDKSDVGSTRRRDIALKVEEMLWQPPFLQDEAFSATLEEFAALFDVSTRTIQIAVQEQFGMGFVALRRLVRLTQLRGAMIEAGGAATLSALATDYRLHFGRLGQEYSQLFGLKPSEELRRLRRQ